MEGRAVTRDGRWVPLRPGGPHGKANGAVSDGADGQPGMPESHVKGARTDPFYLAESIWGLANSRPE